MAGTPTEDRLGVHLVCSSRLLRRGVHVGLSRTRPRLRTPRRSANQSVGRGSQLSVHVPLHRSGDARTAPDVSGPPELGALVVETTPPDSVDTAIMAVTGRLHPLPTSTAGTALPT
jgi:hypothetical protein